MPVVLTFDIEGAPPQERNRIQSLFERLGWQNLGGSSYRYPRLGADQPVEDWFNHVLPALMLFRAYLQKSARPLTKFTLDVQSSTGYQQAHPFGHPPRAGGNVTLYDDANAAFGKENLIAWLDGVDFPY